VSGALAVALREIRERRIVLWAGLILGLLPVAVRWLSLLLPASLAGGPWREVAVFVLAAVAVINFPPAVALGLGSSVIGRDIGERRLGFYFARPISGGAIWGGKMLGALALVVGASLLVFIPIHFLANPFGPSGRPSHLGSGALVVLLTLQMLLLSVAAVAAGSLRSRSGLLLLDIVGLPLVVAVFFWIGARMVDAGATRVVFAFAAPPRVQLLLWPVIGVLLAASAAQVVFGRVEPRRGHLALSAVTLSGLLACALSFALYGGWVTSATPQDLRGGHVAAPTTGDWVVLSGGTRRTDPPDLYTPGFVVNAATGHYARMGGTPFAGSGILWSPDGRRVLWPAERPRSIELLSAQVGAPDLSIVNVATEGTAHLELANRPEMLFYVVERSELWQQPLALSSDGRLLVGARDALRLIEAQREIAHVSGRAQAGIFLPDGRVRLLGEERRGSVSEWQVFDWDGRSDRVDSRATFSTEGASHVRLSPSWDRLLVTEPRRLSSYALDGGHLVTLIEASSAGNRAAGLLSEGRVVCVEESGPGLRLRTFDPDGSTRADVTMPGKFPVRLGGEPLPGLLSVGVDRWDTASLWETVFVDVATGQVRRRESGLTPAARWDTWSAGPVPGSAGTRLFWDSQRALVRFDPATGERRVLIAAGGLPDKE
jgi:hypothetical protein